MKKIKLTTDLWNAKEGDEIEVSFIRAEWAVKKGKAIEVEKTENMKRVNPIIAELRQKAEKQALKNKAETAPKNK